MLGGCCWHYVCDHVCVGGVVEVLGGSVVIVFDWVEVGGCGARGLLAEDGEHILAVFSVLRFECMGSVSGNLL